MHSTRKETFSSYVRTYNSTIDGYYDSISFVFKAAYNGEKIDDVIISMKQSTFDTADEDVKRLKDLSRSPLFFFSKDKRTLKNMANSIEKFKNVNLSELYYQIYDIFHSESSSTNETYLENGDSKPDTIIDNSQGSHSEVQSPSENNGNVLLTFSDQYADNQNSTTFYCTVNSPYNGDYTEWGLVIWDKNNQKLAEAVDTGVTWTVNEMKIWFNTDKYDIFLEPNKEYYYSFYVVFNGEEH